MCPACGHPQEVAERCAACGAALPTPLREGAEAGEPVTGSPFVSTVTTALRLGETELFLRGDALELRRPRGSSMLRVADLEAFRIARWPLFELLAAGFGFAGLAALVHSRNLRLLLLLLDLVMLACAFLYGRYRFTARSKGRGVVSASVVARRGSKEEQQVKQGLSALRAFLTIRGVEERP